MAWSWTSQIPATPQAPAAARTFVETSLSAIYRDPSVIAETCEDVVVIVSELATNAVQAATTSLWVELEVGPGHVRVAVTDEASGMPTVSGPAAFDQPYGRGLAIVAALSRDWGVMPVIGGAMGKTVWARLDLAVAPDA